VVFLEWKMELLDWKVVFLEWKNGIVGMTGKWNN